MAIAADSDYPHASRHTERSSRADALQELLTVEDVAALLKVSKKWVYEHVRSRGTRRSERLPYLKLGKYVRFEARALADFLAKKR
jgi:excisionase family DNA binding protein